MPRVIVISEQGARDSTVVLDEQVSSVHLDSEHSAWQFVERLGWAIGDAEDAEHAKRASIGAPHVRSLAA